MLKPEQRSVLDGLAWEAIRDGLARGAWLPELRAHRALQVPLEGAEPFLHKHAATFVTLHRKGELRGCIGTTRPYQPLGQDVVDHAFAAAFRDPRFPGLRPEELRGLKMEISVLGEPSAVPADDLAVLSKNLRQGVDGLILSAAGRSATFLPSVWDNVQDKEQFITALLRKAGIAPGAWPKGLKAHTYQVQKWPAFEPPQA